MLKIVKATKEDAKFISLNMRQCDQDEFYKANGDCNYEEHILHGLNSINSHTYTLKFNNVPIAIVGTIEKQDFQVVWACGTDDIQRHKVSFMKAMRTLSDKHEMERKPYVNYVDCDNENAIKFLKASGFTLLDKERYGKLQKEFYPFYK